MLWVLVEDFDKGARKRITLPLSLQPVWSNCAACGQNLESRKESPNRPLAHLVCHEHQLSLVNGLSFVEMHLLRRIYVAHDDMISVAQQTIVTYARPHDIWIRELPLELGKFSKPL